MMREAKLLATDIAFAALGVKTGCPQEVPRFLWRVTFLHYQLMASVNHLEEGDLRVSGQVHVLQEKSIWFPILLDYILRLLRMLIHSSLKPDHRLVDELQTYALSDEMQT